MRTQKLLGLIAASTLSFTAFAATPLCEALSPTTAAPHALYTIQKPSSHVAPALKPTEAYMVQLAVLFDGTQTVTAEQAVAQFFDTEFDFNGGDIQYAQVTLAAGQMREVAYVTYYPGENHYGLIFSIYRDAQGAVASATPVAAIQDGEFSCLSSN